jgi:archaellum component FlaG (FlaF/FlaG flagellin family)
MNSNVAGLVVFIMLVLTAAAAGKILNDSNAMVASKRVEQAQGAYRDKKCQ